jgi:hypothetical protein
MDAKAKFTELKNAWKKANETDRNRIQNEIDLFFDSLSEKEKGSVCEAVDEDFNNIHTEIEDIRQTINIRKILEPVLPAISVSYLSKYYFHKTPQWFYQRMNGNRVNGKSASFSDDEIHTLHFAIQDISKKLSTVQF